MLTVITTCVALLRRRLPGDDPSRRDLDEIGHAADRATRLIRQLLLFSSHQIVEVRPVDLDDLLERLRHLIARSLGEAIRLELRLGAGLGLVMVDPGQLEQAVLNLILNARDAMPDGGALTIETARVRADADAPERLQLSVSDTGLGMDRETRSRIFEPFFTTKPVGKGTGLGLATVFAVVAQSGGTIEVKSAPGQGSRFEISLPIARGVAVAAPSDAVADEPACGGTELILLVEDEPMVREAIGVLSDLGYTVLAAADGPTGLRLADEHPGIALLVSDVVMPGMGGTELARQLLARFPSMRVLFLSGYNEEDISGIGVGGGGHAFLQKPFQSDALARRVREVLDG
jgi:two-component system cell cycle sensor histidine kinase/response regulator CckA